MTKHWIYILLVFSLFACKTYKKIGTGGDWTGYEYSYFCPAYSFSETGKMYHPLSILDANHISLAGTDCQVAIDTAKEHIGKRGGASFLGHSKFSSIDITYLDSSAKFLNKRPLFDLKKCGSTKYFIQFLYQPSKHIAYRFGIALNAQFEVISKPCFPDVSVTPNFDQLIGPLKAFRMAKKQNRELLLPLEKLELIYDSKLNCFVWEMQSGVRELEKPKYEYGILKMEAHTGKSLDKMNIIGRRQITPDF